MFRVKEPGEGASVEQLIDAAQKTALQRSRKPEVLARNRLRFLRGFVGPITDHIAGQILDRTKEAITQDPSILDFKEQYMTTPAAYASTVMYASQEAYGQLRWTIHDTFEDGQSVLKSSDTYLHAKEAIRAVRPVYFNDVNVSISEGAQTGFSFPINAASIQIAQTRGQGDYSIIKEATPGDYIDVMSSPSFGRSLYQAALAGNGYWATQSSEPLVGIMSVSMYKWKGAFEPGVEGLTPKFIQNLQDHRHAVNKHALDHAASGHGPKGNDLRLSSGCPVVRPHTGESNIYERASAAVLRSIGANDQDIQMAMAGGSIMKGLSLGIRICELVRDQDLQLPSHDEVDAWRISRGQAPYFAYLKSDL